VIPSGLPAFLCSEDYFSPLRFAASLPGSKPQPSHTPTQQMLTVRERVPRGRLANIRGYVTKGIPNHRMTARTAQNLTKIVYVNNNRICQGFYTAGTTMTTALPILHNQEFPQLRKCTIQFCSYKKTRAVRQRPTEHHPANKL
jgi:hypothetical protein